MKNVELVQKDAFCVIGKPGSTNDGPDFVQKLWKDAADSFIDCNRTKSSANDHDHRLVRSEA